MTSTFIPVIAIVGRPNVGKSTLFNVLTRSRDALVLDLPGVTRDRQYGEGKVGHTPFIVIDTGGLTHEDDHLHAKISNQALQAMNEADKILFMVDAKVGCTQEDLQIAKQLKKIKKPIILLVNKIDGMDEGIALGDFYQLGFKQPLAIAASHGIGTTKLIEEVLPDSEFPRIEASPPDNELEVFEESSSETAEIEEKMVPASNIKIAIVGRPNVGKSTLVNRMLGEERVIVLDQPGTTRDSIFIPLERRDQHYTLIDTAGVRKKAKIKETIEKFSIVKTLQAIEAADVVLLILDAVRNIGDQDLNLLGFICETGRALVIAVNKWDGLESEQKQAVKRELSYRLNFADFASVQFISALHGTGVGDLFDVVQRAYKSATKIVSTGKLTRILEQAVAGHSPPLVKSRRIKLRYAHMGGHQPPLIIIHGNQTSMVPAHYKRYLMKFFREALKLEGTPIRLEFKTSENPYA